MLAALILTAMLGHPDFAVRESAESSLAALGLLAYPPLAGALASSDPEVVDRAARLLNRLRIETDPTTLWLGSFIGMPYCDALPGFAGYLHEARRQIHERGIENQIWLDYRLGTLLWMDHHGPIEPLALSLMQARSMHWDRCGNYPR